MGKSWKEPLKKLMVKDLKLKERVHGDGIKVSIDSPEAFEEVFWKTFSDEEYKELEKTQIIKGLATSEIAEGVYFQIQITAHNIGTETVRFTGGQFYLFDINQEKYDAIFIGYAGSDIIEELSRVDLLPGSSVTVTTQFDIPYDEEMKYTIGILPDRFGLQESQERGFVCIKNC